MTEPTLKQLLLQAPDGSLDACMFPLIEKWNEPDATSLQILEVLDHCIYGALTNGFTTTLLQVLYDHALERERKTHEDNLPFATWRDR